jgi:hypothetical protein
MKFLRSKTTFYMASLLLLMNESISNAYADSPEPSLGGLAANITAVIANLGNFLTAIAFIIGFGFAIGSIIKYKAHRDNPQMVGLKEPITMLVLSLAFIALGFVSLFVGKQIFGPSGGYQGTTGF